MRAMNRFHTGDEKVTIRQAIAYNLRAIKMLHKIRPWALFTHCIISALNTITPLLILFLSSLVISELAGGRDVRRIIIYVSFTVGIGFLLSLIDRILWHIRTKIGGRDIWECMLMMLETQHTTMDYAYVEDAEVATLRAEIQARLDANQQGLMRLVYHGPRLFGHIGAFIGAAIILVGMFFVPSGDTFITSNLALILLILVSVSVPSLITTAIIKHTNSTVNSIMSTIAKYNVLWQYYAKTYTQTPDGGLDVRIFKLSTPIINAIEKSQNWYKNGWVRMQGRALGIIHVTGAVFMVLAYLVIGLRALEGMYDIGEVTRFVGAVTAFSTNLAGMLGGLSDFRENAPYLGQTFDYMDLPQHASKSEQGRKVDINQPVEISFHNVSFKYPRTDVYALKNINITFAQGQRLAVVGMNGSGKTTMIKLLCRLYEPTEGYITLNGININEYDYEEYLKTFAVVFQEFFIMALSIGQNLATNLHYDPELATTALEKAGFGDRLKELELGLDTILFKNYDESGITISGGEKQKIALARAIYKDAPFVVLDEPTAALDPIAEFEVYSKFNDLISDKTAIFVSHRLSSCRFCHHIAVFHEGEIIQYGTHEGLLKDSGGKYNEMWYAQAQYYEE